MKLIEGTIEKFLLYFYGEKRKLYERWYNSNLLAHILKNFTIKKNSASIDKIARELAIYLEKNHYKFDMFDFSFQIIKYIDDLKKAYRLSRRVERYMTAHNKVLYIDYGEEEKTKDEWVCNILKCDLEIESSKGFVESLQTRKQEITILRVFEYASIVNYNAKIDNTINKYYEVEARFQDMIENRVHRLHNPTYVKPILTENLFIIDSRVFVKKAEDIMLKLNYNKALKSQKQLIDEFFKLVFEINADAARLKRKVASKNLILKKYNSLFFIVQRGLEILEDGLKICEKYNTDLKFIQNPDNKVSNRRKLKTHQSFKNKLLTLTN